MKKELIPEYVELLSDEEVVVKETAIESVIEIIDMLDSGKKEKWQIIYLIPLTLLVSCLLFLCCRNQDSDHHTSI